MEDSVPTIAESNRFIAIHLQLEVCRGVRLEGVTLCIVLVIGRLGLLY